MLPSVTGLETFQKGSFLPGHMRAVPAMPPTVELLLEHTVARGCSREQRISFSETERSASVWHKDNDRDPAGSVVVVNLSFHRLTGLAPEAAQVQGSSRAAGARNALQYWECFQHCSPTRVRQRRKCVCVRGGGGSVAALQGLPSP